MLKYLTIIFCLIAPPSMAQTADPAAIGSVLLSCIGREVQAAGRIAQLEAEIAKLKAAVATDERKP